MGYYIILLVMTIIGACASFCLKKASNAQGIQELFFAPMLYLGGSLYLLSAFLNIFILKHLDYSVVLPLTSITYVWTFLLSYFYLNEVITERKAYGIGLIILGSIIIAL